jgi:hypothetical protein
MKLSDVTMFASTHTQMALTLFLMMSRMRIQQQLMQMTTKSQMILPTVTQADIEFDMYMELPAGIEMKYGNGKTHVLKLLKNLYGQKQAR